MALTYKGPPIRELTVKNGHRGFLSIVCTAPLETAHHAFIDCHEVKRAWVQFNNLKQNTQSPVIKLHAGRHYRGHRIEKQNPGHQED
jgi:hypothetical protein